MNSCSLIISARSRPPRWAQRTDRACGVAAGDHPARRALTCFRICRQPLAGSTRARLTWQQLQAKRWLRLAPVETSKPGLIVFLAPGLVAHAEVLAPDHPVFHRDSTDQVLAQDRLNPLGGHAAVNHPIGPDQQDRPLGADPQAVGFGAQHDAFRPGGILQSQLPHQLLEAGPAGGADRRIRAAEGLGGGGAEQQVVADADHSAALVG